MSERGCIRIDRGSLSTNHKLVSQNISSMLTFQPLGCSLHRALNSLISSLEAKPNRVQTSLITNRHEVNSPEAKGRSVSLKTTLNHMT